MNEKKEVLEQKAKQVVEIIAKHYDARSRVCFDEYGAIAQFQYFEIRKDDFLANNPKNIDEAGKWVDAFGCQIPYRDLENRKPDELGQFLIRQLKHHYDEFMNNKLRYKGGKP